MTTKIDSTNAELMYSNNTNTAGAIAHSHLVTHGKLDDIKAEALVNQTTIDATIAELAYANNTSTTGSLAHSLVTIATNTGSGGDSSAANQVIHNTKLDALEATLTTIETQTTLTNSMRICNWSQLIWISGLLTLKCI